MSDYADLLAYYSAEGYSGADAHSFADNAIVPRDEEDVGDDSEEEGGEA